MKYCLEDLSDDQFEKMIVSICRVLLGEGTQGFAKGPDGGRDAKFIGTANLIPSEKAPWHGKVIIQAKHTNGYNKSFSDSDFYSKTSASSVLRKEIPKIAKLRESGELDHYMLFSNRKLPAGASQAITKVISEECDIPEESILLLGQESIEHWLDINPHIVKNAKIDLIDAPLIVSPDELAEIVYALEEHKAEVLTSISTRFPSSRTTYERKNKINNMSEDYADGMRKLYLKETQEIHHFLSLPANTQLLKVYENAVDEFHLKIFTHQAEFDNFDKVMDYLFDLLTNRSDVLKRNKRLTRALLFYMYWNCDIGKSENA